MHLHVPGFVRRWPRLHRLLRILKRAAIRRLKRAPTRRMTHHSAFRRVHIPLPAPPTTTARPNPPAVLTLVASRDLRLPKILAQHGLLGHEPQVIATFLAAIDHADAGSVLDVGANIGLYAALAAAFAGDRRICAFEPAPDLAATARRFAADNELPVEVEAIALGACNGSATLYLSDVADTSNSLLPGFRESSQQIEVPLETLDHWCARRNTAPAVLKIDTEATDHEVIRGGTEVIVRHRPFILCEVLRRERKTIAAAIRPLGYHWYHISGEVPFRRVKTLRGGDPERRDRMYLFAPEPPKKKFWRSVQAWDERIARCTAADRR